MHSQIIAILATAACALSTAAIAQDAGKDAGSDPKKIDAGESVYNNYCETCHGMKLVNIGQSSFDLRRLRADERPRFETSVMNGRGNMPPWKGVIDAEQMDVLWAFVRANAK